MNKNELMYDEYLQSNKARNNETYNTTYKMYKSRMIDFIKFLNEQEDGIYMFSDEFCKSSVRILEKYISDCRDRGNNNQTINNKITAISSFFIWAVKRDIVPYHPFQNKLDRLKVKDFDKRRESYFLSTEEVIKVKVVMEQNKYKDIDRILWELMVDTGARISAIQNIKVNQIDFESGMIRGVKEKGCKIVDLLFFKEVGLLMKKYIDDKKLKSFDYLFKSCKHKPISQSTIRNKIKRIGGLVGYSDLYPHSVRKTAINKLYKIGGIEIASEFANHSDTKVTKDHYVKKRTSEDKRSLIQNLYKNY